MVEGFVTAASLDGFSQDETRSAEHRPLIPGLKQDDETFSIILVIRIEMTSRESVISNDG